jgi:hypothetical protein
VAERRPPLVRDRSFTDQSALTGRWYFVDSWRPAGEHGREAHTKHDITDAINRIIADHGGDPSATAHDHGRGRSGRGVT